jgi:predicted RNase H-like nuclease (RuvC/YqgF family)
MLEEAIAEQKANGPIMLQRPGQEPLRLSSEQVVNIIKQQQEQLQALEEKNNQNAKYIGLLQQKLIELKKNPAEPTPSAESPASPAITTQLNEYIAANQSLQERLIASVRDISTLKQEIARLNEYIASSAAAAAAEVAQAPENVILSVIAEEPEAEIIAKTKSSPEITVDMSDI